MGLLQRFCLRSSTARVPYNCREESDCAKAKLGNPTSGSSSISVFQLGYFSSLPTMLSKSSSAVPGTPQTMELAPETDVQAEQQPLAALPGPGTLPGHGRKAKEKLKQRQVTEKGVALLLYAKACKFKLLLCLQSWLKAIMETLQTLPPPFGPSAATQYRDLQQLEQLYTAASGCHAPMLVDWSSMPPSCDPVCVLDSTANRTRKKGVPIEQQVKMIQYDGGHTAQAAGAGDSSTTSGAGIAGTVAANLPWSTGAGLQLDTAATRGQQKRFQCESFMAVLRLLLNPAACSGEQAHQGTSQGCRDGSQQHSIVAGQSGQPVQRFHVVDFGCGTGSLLLPLAHAFPGP
jgi:hypothetical protein